MDDDDKTTPENTPPENNPPPEPPHDNHAECRGLIHTLTERIDEVENTLRTVISVKPDSSPVNKPWTHRRLFR